MKRRKSSILRPKSGLARRNRGSNRGSNKAAKKGKRRSSVVQLGGIANTDDTLDGQEGGEILDNVYTRVYNQSRGMNGDSLEPNMVEPRACWVSADQNNVSPSLERRASMIAHTGPLIPMSSPGWVGRWIPANQSANFGMACTHALHQLVRCRVSRVFIQTTMAGHRSMVYLDSANVVITPPLLLLLLC